MSIVDWFVEVIEGVFIQSELVELNQSNAELCETASLDSLCSFSVGEHNSNSDVPIGKQVI